MPDVVNGKDVWMLRKIDDVYIVIGCATSISFTLKNELIGKTDVNAGLFRKKRVRISDNTASISGLQALKNSSDRLSIVYFLQESVRRQEQPLRFIWQDESGYQYVIDGNFLVEEVSITSPVEDFSEYEMTLQGTGGFTPGAVIYPPDDPICEVQSPLYIPVVAGQYSVSDALLKTETGFTKTILEVEREGIGHDETSGTPGNRTFNYTANGTTGTITFDSTNPFNAGEIIFVLYKKTTT